MRRVVKSRSEDARRGDNHRTRRTNRHDGRMRGHQPGDLCTVRTAEAVVNVGSLCRRGAGSPFAVQDGTVWSERRGYRRRACAFDIERAEGRVAQVHGSPEQDCEHHDTAEGTTPPPAHSVSIADTSDELAHERFGVSCYRDRVMCPSLKGPVRVFEPVYVIAVFLKPLFVHARPQACSRPHPPVVQPTRPVPDAPPALSRQPLSLSGWRNGCSDEHRRSRR